MNTGKYIYAKLAADAGVTALVANRIYPVYLPQNAVYPAIVYLVENEPVDRQKDLAAYLDRATVKFHIWASAAQGENGYAAVEDIDTAIRDTIDFVGADTAGGVSIADAEYLGSSDGRDDEMTLFMRTATYRIVTQN